METAQLILDTDVVIDHLRRKSQLLIKAIDQFECAITAVTLYELLAVPALSHRQQKALQDVLTLMPVLPLNHEAAQAAAEVWRDLRVKGVLIGIPDTLIAGICLVHGMPLLTLNQRHYGRVPLLTLLSPLAFE